MIDQIKLVPYEHKYADAVRQCAREAWTFTYKKIFSTAEIEAFIRIYYSDESNERAEDLIAQKLLQFTLAMDDQILIGFQVSSINLLQPELTRLYVLPDKIGAGIGSILLRDSENFFKKNGFTSYEVRVHKHNVIGQKFYERRGFIFSTIDDHDHFILKKNLD